MKTEMRNDEVFKKWCFDTKLVINKNWFNLENPSGDEVYVAWLAWQASASREGYKLVPVEMHWHKAGDLASAEWDKHKALFCSDNRDMTAIQVEEFRLRWCKNKAHKIMSDYKEMIGVIE